MLVNGRRKYSRLLFYTHNSSLGFILAQRVCVWLLPMDESTISQDSQVVPYRLT
jgi:hypothetical protein